MNDEPTNEALNIAISRIMGLKEGVDFGEVPHLFWGRWGDGGTKSSDCYVQSKVCMRCRMTVEQRPTCTVEAPDYCGDISLAWGVVEKMLAEGYWFVIENDMGFEGLYYLASLESMSRDRVMREARTAPRAICLAVLVAVGEKE